MLQMAEGPGKRPGKDQATESRKGRKSLTVWVPEDLAVALKVLAAEERVSMQDMVIDFMNDGLEKHGKPRIKQA